MSNNNSRIYFANKQGSELVQDILSKVEAYDTYLQNSGAMSRVAASYSHYYALKKGGLHISKSGDNGEINNLSINHFRNIIQHAHVLATQNKLAFEVSATNSDYEAQSQCLLGKSILEYENTDKGLNSLMLGLVEGALLYGEHFISVRWDSDGGEPVAADLEAQREVMSGTMKYCLHHMKDVIRDTALASNQQQKYIILREQVNRYDLAASFPEFADAILSAPSPGHKLTEGSFKLLSRETDDLVEMIALFHDQSAACKQGRQVSIVGDTIIADSPLLYRRIPVFRLAASNIDNTILGYTLAFDLVGIQQASDALVTAALTNNLTFSLQNIWSPDANIKMSDLGDGLSLITSTQKPEPVQLTSSAPELYKLVDMLQAHSQLISGINSVTRGQPEASLKSGASLALVAAQAISFMSNLQNAYATVAGEIGTAVLETMQRWATAPQLISVVGSTKRAMTRAFSNSDISKIKKVTVRLGNALQQTVAGKVELANQMLRSGVIKDARQYLAVIETGSLDALDEVDVNEMMLARSENERLQEGGDVVALLIDNHVEHINAHKSVLADPEVRRNPTVVKAVMAHIQEHIDLMRQVPPDLASVIGMQPLPPNDPQEITPMDAPMPQDPDAPAGMPAMPNMNPAAPMELQAAADQIPTPPGVK